MCCRIVGKPWLGPMVSATQIPKIFSCHLFECANSHFHSYINTECPYDQKHDLIMLSQKQSILRTEPLDGRVRTHVGRGGHSERRPAPFMISCSISLSFYNSKVNDDHNSILPRLVVFPWRPQTEFHNVCQFRNI